MIISFLSASLSKEITLYINKRMKSGKNIRNMMMKVMRAREVATRFSIKSIIYVLASML